jgi:hypothetical protein
MRRYVYLALALGLALLFAGGLGLSACYDVPQPACGFRCGPAGECPTDYTCNSADDRCHLNGSPAMVCGVPDGGVDAPDIDAPPDAAIDAAIDAELDAPPDAAIDAPPDAAIDAPPDAAIDAPPDAPPDANP